MKMVMPSCIAHRSLSLVFNPEVNVKQTTTACITEKKKKKNYNKLAMHVFVR